MTIDPVDLTRTLIQFKSVNPPGDESRCAAFLGDLLTQGGFRTKIVEFGVNRSCVVARRGRKDCDTPPICMTGHLDTVPLGHMAWSVDPFGGEIIDGRIYGRGSTDMKSGVAAMLVAALAVGEQLDDGPGLLLVLTGGEETGCKGALHLVGMGEGLGKAGAIVVGEPTGNLPRLGHKGALWLAATCCGVAAHGSMPELGVNAIYRGMEVVSKLRDFGFNWPPHDQLGSPTVNVGTIAGGTAINSVPDHTEICIDIRTLPGMKHEAIVSDLHRHLAPDIAQLETVLDLESVWTAPENPWIAQVSTWLRPGEGDEAKAGVPFFTDASVLQRAFGDPPTLILGPGETRLAHQTDEYCFVHRIHEAVGLYERLILDWQKQ